MDFPWFTPVEDSQTMNPLSFGELVPARKYNMCGMYSEGTCWSVMKNRAIKTIHLSVLLRITIQALSTCLQQLEADHTCSPMKNLTFVGNDNFKVGGVNQRDACTSNTRQSSTLDSFPAQV